MFPTLNNSKSLRKNVGEKPEVWHPWPRTPLSVLFVAAPTMPQVLPHPRDQVLVAIYHQVCPVDFLFGDLKEKGTYFSKSLDQKYTNKTQIKREEWWGRD